MVFKIYRQFLFLKSVCTHIKLLKIEKKIGVMYTLIKTKKKKKRGKRPVGGWRRGEVLQHAAVLAL